jgi:tRNA-splicing ligase RtcB
MSDEQFKFVDVKEATAKIVLPSKNIINVIGNEYIRNTFEHGCLQQAANMADAPGVTEMVINPDAHWGYGTCVGSVFASPDVIYPNAVGPDVKCSMSFLQFNIPVDTLKDNKLRAKLIKAIEERIPTGPGNHMPAKARPFDLEVLKRVAHSGAVQRGVLDDLAIPANWASLCEDATHGDPDELQARLSFLMDKVPALDGKLRQLGGVGGGNHFLECNVVNVKPEMESVANTFGLVNGFIGFLCHFGSRGFGFSLTSGCKGWPGQFKLLEEKFNQWRVPFPGGDNHNVYAPVGTEEARNYLNDMALGANFATVNHLLVCTYVMEAFTEVLGNSVEANLVYYIAHNIIRREIVDKNFQYVHRKGATRAFPAGHYELKDTPFYKTGHPILLPGNPVEGSTIMVAQHGSRKALNSVNHGAGRAMSRKKASETFRQRDIVAHFDAADIITNCGRNYPVDECAQAYKPYSQVIESVEKAGLALTVAKLIPRFVIKDNDTRKETSA